MSSQRNPSLRFPQVRQLSQVVVVHAFGIDPAQLHGQSSFHFVSTPRSNDGRTTDRPNRCTVSGSLATSRRARPGQPRSSDAWFSSSVLLTAVKPPQPGYLTQCEAVTTPFDRLAHRQALVVGHRSQRVSGAPLSVLDRTVAFTERGQHGDRQPLQSAFPVGPFLAPRCLGIQR